MLYRNTPSKLITVLVDRLIFYSEAFNSSRYPLLSWCIENVKYGAVGALSQDCVLSLRPPFPRVLWEYDFVLIFMRLQICGIFLDGSPKFECSMQTIGAVSLHPFPESQIPNVHASSPIHGSHSGHSVTTICIHRNDVQLKPMFYYNTVSARIVTMDWWSLLERR